MCDICLEQTSNCCSRCSFIAKKRNKRISNGSHFDEIDCDFVFDKCFKFRVVGNYSRDKRQQDKLIA